MATGRRKDRRADQADPRPAGRRGSAARSRAGRWIATTHSGRSRPGCGWVSSARLGDLRIGIASTRDRSMPGQRLPMRKLRDAEAACRRHVQTPDRGQPISRSLPGKPGARERRTIGPQPSPRARGECRVAGRTIIASLVIGGRRKRAHDRAVDGNLLAVAENDLAGDPEGRIAADLGLRVQYRLGAARAPAVGAMSAFPSSRPSLSGRCRRRR